MEVWARTTTLDVVTMEFHSLAEIKVSFDSS